MSFKLSNRSLSKLEGVNESLVQVVKQAITLTTVDFGVTQGLRTLEEQERLVATGRSQTMKSKHLEGLAVDVVAYIDGQVCWEINVYDDIADAFKTAAQDQGVALRWGAAWTVPNICEWESTMEAAYLSYVDTRRSQGRRPFIDAPHFEMV